MEICISDHMEIIYTYLMLTDVYVYTYVLIGVYTRNISSPLPYTYDQSNNGSICNDMPVVVKVAEPLEPYIYAQSGKMIMTIMKMIMMSMMMMMILIVMMMILMSINCSIIRTVYLCRVRRILVFITYVVFAERIFNM
jgi:hypothetical protein